jgi:hypothetical protein
VPQAGAVLRDGRVIQRGRHAELTELDAKYAELYTLQAAQYGYPRARRLVTSA